MRHILAITKALSDLNRIRVLCALKGRGELCVCQIQELLALAPSTTSKHLSLLSGAGLVQSRKEGRWAYYRISDESEMPEDAAEILGWLCRQAAKEKAIVSDCCKLGTILSYSPEELCQLQAKGIKCCAAGTGQGSAAVSHV